MEQIETTDSVFPVEAYKRPNDGARTIIVTRNDIVSRVSHTNIFRFHRPSCNVSGFVKKLFADKRQPDRPLLCIGVTCDKGQHGFDSTKINGTS